MVSGTHRRVYCYYYYFCCCRHCHLVPIAIEFATPGLEQWPSTRDRFTHQEIFGNIWRHSSCDWGGACCWLLVDRGKEHCWMSYNTQESFTTIIICVNCVKVEDTSTLHADAPHTHGTLRSCPSCRENQGTGNQSLLQSGCWVFSTLPLLLPAPPLSLFPTLEESLLGCHISAFMFLQNSCPFTVRCYHPQLLKEQSANDTSQPFQLPIKFRRAIHFQHPF